MREILGIVIFWISTIGYVFILKDKTKLTKELLLPMTFTLIGISMFISGILNLMKEISIVICLVGVLLTLYYGLKKKKFNQIFLNIKNRKININIFLVICLLIYISIIGTHMHLLHYDNFSHWGLIVKNMFLSDALPNFQNTALEFLDYQPGSACFIYYIGFLAGKSEGTMIVAQNYLIITYFLSILIFVKDNTKKSNIIRFLILSVLLFTMFVNVRFNDLLVDTLIAVMSIYSIVLLYYFKDNLKRAYIYTLPISIYLFLVKNTGIVLVGINCLILFILGYKNKNIKKGFVYAILTGIITLAFFYIWSKHVTYVYGNYALSAKHSMSAHNIVGSLREKGMENILNFCLIYIKHFVDILHNIPNKYIIGINILYIILIILYKQKSKIIFKYLLFSDIIYLGYYIILGLMYLLSMPWEEAKILASFDRYMLTIICVIIGILLICIINIICEEKKSKLKTYAYLMGIIVLVNFLTFNYYVDDIKLLWGDLDYKNSNAYKYDTILKNNMYNSNDDDFYYIYTPNTQNDSGYMYYLTRYKLNTYKFELFYNINDINNLLKQNENKNYQEKIILFVEDNELINYIEKNNFKKSINEIYIKN
ncbi:MAG: hypothetical protein PUH84_02885 [Firmicutes bacterium]|nr:hypothetical protein [Bacillota bacterium]MDY5335738.1 hypothetical protein [Bacilli bacterium]